MNLRNAMAAGLVCSMMSLASVRAEQTLESVEKEITKAAADLKAVSAKVTTTGKMESMGRKMSMDADGSTESMVKEGKELSRTEMTTNMTVGEGDSAMKMTSSMLNIDDGEFSWVLREQMGQKMAMKMKSNKNSTPTINSTQMFATLRERFELKLLPDEKTDGHDVFVIEATPKDPSDGMPIKNTLLYIDKKTGVTVKHVVNDTSGSPMMTTTLTDIKINPTIEASRFVFTAPEGVVVMDQTNR